ncbi:MAG: tRNA-binding protein [Acidiferrobacterales bacterium]
MDRLNTIEFDDFLKVELCTGTITAAKLNPKARQASYILSIDFGEKGTRISSAQLTANYAAEELVGKQIVAVMNFAPKRIAGVKSEVLVLGAVCPKHGVVLLEPSYKVNNGVPIA